LCEATGLPVIGDDPVVFDQFTVVLRFSKGSINQDDPSAIANPDCLCNRSQFGPEQHSPIT
jgi:hypothetical protein